MQLPEYNNIERQKILRTTIFRNLIECYNCGETYAIEFSLARYMERQQMISTCLYCGHINDTKLFKKYQYGAPIRLIDQAEFERPVICDN
jgi:uncharacterized Zn finger protein